MSTVEVAADLHLAFTALDGRAASAHLHGEHNRLVLDVDEPGLFAGNDDAPVVRRLAETLASRGVRVEVRTEGRHLVTLGATTAPWWQRRATGSKRIRVGSLRGAWTSLRARAAGTVGSLPDAGALPPPTLFPFTPTFARVPRRPMTTTHGAPGAGSPRLILANADLMDGERSPTYWLTREVTTIGSAASCDIVLPGVQDHHATVVRTEADEFEVRTHGPEIRVHGAVVRASHVLRTGSRVQVGPYALSFYREEYADHGRPYGGRIGGEAGHQQPQPPREALRT